MVYIATELTLSRRKFVKNVGLAALSLVPSIASASRQREEKYLEYQLEAIVNVEGQPESRLSIQGTTDYLRRKFREMMTSGEIPDVSYMDTQFGFIDSDLSSNPNYVNEHFKITQMGNELLLT